MTPEVKKRVRRYGIPIDLVILATGIAGLFPDMPGFAIVLIYLFAVAASTVKSGWRSGLTAAGLAALMMLFGFGDNVRASHELSLVLISLGLIGADEWRRHEFVNPLTLPEVREFGEGAAAQWDALRARVGPSIQQFDRLAADRFQHLIARTKSLSAAAGASAQERSRAAVRWSNETIEGVRQRLARPKAELPPPPAAPIHVPPAPPAVEPPVVVAAPPPPPPAPAPTAAPVQQPLPLVRPEITDEEREGFIRRERERMERRLAEERRAVEEEMNREREELARRLEENRQILERSEAERAERERVDAERNSAVRAAAQRLAAERQERQKLEREREELSRRLEEERQATERAVAERAEQAKREAEQTLEQRLAEERAAMQRKYDEQLRTELEKAAKAATAAAEAPPRPGLFATMISWLKTPQHSKPVVNLKTKRVAGNTTIPRQKVSANSVPPGARGARASASSTQPMRTAPSRERRPRVLMLERRRQMADTMAPKLKAQSVDVQIVERWIDAVDELFRFRPDAIFVDAELPDFARIHQSIFEQAPRLPLFVTTGSYGALPNLPRAAAVMRPYAADAIAKHARDAMENPQQFLERQKVRQGGAVPSPAAVVSTPGTTPVIPRPSTPPPRSSPPASSLFNAPSPSPPPRPAAPPPVSAPRPAVPQPPPRPVAVPTPAPTVRPAVATDAAKDRYSVVCFNCHVAFDAGEAEWCSCLTKDRTLICTNCLTCFCAAPPSYKEKFWFDAPPRLVERKAADLRKQMSGVIANPPPDKVRRPLVMLVEDNEDIQHIVQKVCTNLGYGFVYASNGQDGLNIARQYKPDLILSDAFMPKLDGREMCRILKEEGTLPNTKMIVMTGLYTDTKYRSEALERFHVDDYLTKPVLITDLINLLQKNLEGLTGTPAQENLHERHRREIDAAAAAEGEEPRKAEATTYEVCCATCNEMFDAMQAEWCRDPGREQTLVCPHCQNCFCKAPAAYKERFWIDAPTALFERKTINSKRNVGKSNPPPDEVARPLILFVDDDEDIHLIVRTVVTTMGYGFISAMNGEEGLALAREYNPDLILSDAFMPKLDGREMCRQLKEDPATARTKAIIMTGLYTDRKYRSEALTHFKVDDYVAKPVAVDDLIKLMKKYLPQDMQQTM